MLRQLDAVAFLSFLSLLFEALWNVILRGKTLCKAVEKVKDVFEQTNTLSDRPIDIEQVLREANEVLAGLCETATKSVSQVLATRKEQHGSLGMKQIKSLFDSVLVFVSATEEVCGKTCYGLRGTLLSQV